MFSNLFHQRVTSLSLTRGARALVSGVLCLILLSCLFLFRPLQDPRPRAPAQEQKTGKGLEKTDEFILQVTKFLTDYRLTLQPPMVKACLRE